MKKTMFITSVIMVVVMAIALTTSSLAWFTASSASVVTTQALTVTAKAQASSGLQISVTSATAGWHTTVTLEDGEGTGNAANDGIVVEKMPLLPLSGEADPDADDLIAALAAHSFIGQYVAQDNKFAYANGDTGAAVSPYTNGYYTDDVWVSSLASGNAAADVYVVPTVTFKTAAGAAYTASDRHPDLFVAILADTDDTDNTDTWEIVNIFHSNTTNAAKVKVGKEAADFASGEAVATVGTDVGCSVDMNISSLVAVSTSTVNGATALGTSTALAACADDADFGVAKHFRIVAWYAADALDNNNSTVSGGDPFALQIIVSFADAASLS